jgi:hypothetical protein
MNVLCRLEALVPSPGKQQQIQTNKTHAYAQKKDEGRLI